EDRGRRPRRARHEGPRYRGRPFATQGILRLVLVRLGDPDGPSLRPRRRREGRPGGGDVARRRRAEVSGRRREKDLPDSPREDPRTVRPEEPGLLTSRLLKNGCGRRV